MGKARIATGVLLVTLVTAAMGYTIASAVLTYQDLGFGAEIDFAYIAQNYGRPSRGRHAVQIEINRSLYMNEQLIRPNGNFQSVKKLVTAVLRQMIRGEDALQM